MVVYFMLRCQNVQDWYKRQISSQEKFKNANILKPNISNFISFIAVTKSNMRVTIMWKYSAHTPISEKWHILFNSLV